MSLAFASATISAEEFRRRRADAVRDGNPAWLWPEVSVASWSVAVANISSASSSVLAGKEAELPPGELMALSLACYTSGMGPLLGWWVEQGQLNAPREISELLAIHLEHGRERAKRIGEESQTFIRALTDSGVPVVVLKGAHSAYGYFPDPATRPMSDLDLLVPADSAVQADVALARTGLVCAGRRRRESTFVSPGAAREPRALWLAHCDDPWSVDLHSSLDFSAGPGAPLVGFDTADPVGTSGPWPLDDAAGVLSQPLLFLYLAVHASGGLQSLTLLRMVELVLVARQDSAGGALSWDEVLHVGAATNALGAAYPALRMAERLAPGTIMARVLEIAAELAPKRARSVVDKLDPATAQRVGRASLAEHFMWVSGLSGWTRQLASDLFPRGGDRSSRSIYEARIQALLRGRITR